MFKFICIKLYSLFKRVTFLIFIFAKETDETGAVYQNLVFVAAAFLQSIFDLQ